ncbi:MAG: alpha/beta hydrolase [Hyphomicrobiaceae bacterium]|nr:alpha/beta hydrolase [Hyphomicrobiaceae bacterium]
MLTAHVDGRAIEYRMIPGDVVSRPTLVFLHEGLGCAALWRDFPDKVAGRLGARTLVYSRFGYGASDGLPGKREPGFMHEEALHVLPRLLDRLGVDAPVLVGHSDGASIALIHAGLAQRPVTGVAVLAPHVFVEQVTVDSIADIRAKYLSAGHEASGLRTRLSRYHARVDDAFLGWADIWLDPRFRDWSIEDAIPSIAAPVLVVQGRQDEYGTLAQLDRIAQAARVPVTRLELDACGHAPHRDQEQAVIDAIVTFVQGLAVAG